VPKSFSLGAVALLLGIFSNQGWCETPAAVTACELVESPQQYDGHLVTFRAQAEGDWFERSPRPPSRAAATLRKLKGHSY
jgi:hypothetical protein